MWNPTFIACLVVLVPIAVIIIFYDVRYRRIPNSFVLATLTSGILVNTIILGFQGLYGSIAGCVLAFILMFILHIFGAMGAGDVKLFAAIGAVTGVQLVIPTFLVVVLTGGLLGIISMVRGGMVRSTTHRVLQIFVGLLPGWEMPKFAIPADRTHTIPYGVAIMLGSIISTTIFRA
jgi:prepilin peptidase CpaA